ncbi:hypothetical protein HYT23_03160 [Candidatus Pacearchaeota archaeon]|nr:hypothetical protein [Candidatus Pacearchaeota archaeon]
MNLKKKKQLAAKTLNVGKDRIIFLKPRLNEIKDVITKQDIRDLYASGAIILKEIKGRLKNKKPSKRRGAGKVGIKINTRKRDYIILTRKLRAYLKSAAKNQGLPKKAVEELRKKIRNKYFKNKLQLKEHLAQK